MTTPTRTAASPTASDAHASALSLAVRVRAGEVFARDLAHAALQRIRTTHGALNTCLHIVDEDRALRAAEAIDRAVAQGKGDALHLAGVPIVVKDNLCTGPELDAPTTCASAILANYRSPFTATSVQRLIDAGAIVLAKTAMDEFAMGSSGESCVTGPTRNPRDPSRVPGGSSSGSAACVAAGDVPLSLGSDTGGSIRQPASFCGLVGVKPTYGRVSRSGLVAYASSLDQVGPITTSVRDAALALQVLCGHDPLDATSTHQPAPALLSNLEDPITGLTLGVPRQARSDANHPDVSRAFDDALRIAQELGARVIDVDIPSLDHAVAAYYIVAPAEASSNLARYDGIRYGHSTDRAALRASAEPLLDLYRKTRSEGFGPEVRRRILLGTHVLSSGYAEQYYLTALRLRRKLLDEFRAVFAGAGGVPTCHAILTPSTPGPAFRIGEKTSDPLALYLEDVYTVGVNLAGLPALSLPMGATRAENLPLGLQLIGRAFDEATLLRAARMLEGALRAS